MATVDKNFKVKNGLIVEGTTATVNGEDVITTGSTTDSLPEGSTNKYYSTTQAKSDAADLLTGATLTNITITGDETGLTITAENGGIQDLSGFDTDDLTEGATNLYFTDGRARSAILPGVGVNLNTATGYIDVNLGTGLETDGSNNIQIDRTTVDAWYDAAGAAASAQTAAESYADGLASNYDAAGAAATAESNANTYTDTEINGLTTNEIEEGLTNLYFTNQRALDATAAAYDAAGAAAAAQSAAESYADGLAVNYDAAGSAAAAQTAAEGYTDTAIANLVDGAPSLLNTLNELAAAINDDESFATTVASSISAKQDTLTAGTGITIDQITDTISVTANTYEAYGAAGTAETNANTYTDTAIDALTTTDIEEGTNLYFTDTRAVDALEAVVPNFTAVEVNSLAKQVAATATSLGSVEVTAYSFPKTLYRTAKFIVKIDNGTENEVTEVLLTLDSSDNIAITEYAIVGTNGNRGTITADLDGLGLLVRLRVNPVNDSTINVVGTLLA